MTPREQDLVKAARHALNKCVLTTFVAQQLRCALAAYDTTPEQDRAAHEARVLGKDGGRMMHPENMGGAE